MLGFEGPWTSVFVVCLHVCFRARSRVAPFLPLRNLKAYTRVFASFCLCQGAVGTMLTVSTPQGIETVFFLQVCLRP